MNDRAVMDVFLNRTNRDGWEYDKKKYVKKEDLHRYIFAEEGANQHV
jgi:hypothetical protein